MIEVSGVRIFHFNTQLGQVANNATLGPQARNRILNPANREQGSANWATQAIAESSATSSVLAMGYRTCGEAIGNDLRSSVGEPCAICSVIYLHNGLNYTNIQELIL